MGLHLNWLAAQGVEKEKLLERLGLEACGWAGDELNSDYACAVLPSGWVLVVSAAYALDLNRLLPVASQDGFVLGAEVSERAMFSSLKGWRSGTALWAVTSDADQPGRELLLEGDPPDELAQIRERSVVLQAAEPDEPIDYMFDVPVELAKILCGYDANGRIALEWTILRPVGGAAGRPKSRELTFYDAFNTELLPLMHTRGWHFDPHLADWRLARVQNGRLQALWFTWKDDGRDIYFAPDFAAWSGESRDTAFLVGGGEIRRKQARLSFRARLAAGWRALTTTQTVEERTQEVVALARRDLLAIDHFLTTGDAEAGLRARHGSLEAWREALRQP